MQSEGLTHAYREPSICSTASTSGAEKLDELRERMSNLANVVEARAQVTAQGVGDLKAEVRAMKAQIDALAAALLPK